MRPALVLILLAVGAFALGACGKDSEPGDRASDTTATPTQAQTATTPKPVAAPRRTKDGCAPVAESRPRDEPVRPPRRKLKRAKRYVAILITNCGSIHIKLDVKNFPRTTRSFAGLTRTGFYNGLSFHRIAKPGGNDFVIQGGDPLGSGEGGPGYKVVESPKRSQGYPVGMVAMAKAGDEEPGTSGSQFFIVTGQGAVLDPVYAIIGRVSKGLNVVRRIAAVPTDPVTEMPIDPVIIRRATIRESKG